MHRIEQDTTAPETDLEPYEPPAILEDLELESFSLACDKASAGCATGGGVITS